jgi:hypothetical protein
LDLTLDEYISERHIGGVNCEKVLGVGFSGINTKASGDLLTCTLNKLDVPARYGTAAAPNGNVRMLHIVLVAEAIVTIQLSGTSVAD